MLLVQNTAVWASLSNYRTKQCVFSTSNIKCVIVLLVGVSSTPMSRYIILNTVISTHDEVNEKGGIRGANHKIDELSRVESSRVESSRRFSGGI